MINNNRPYQLKHSHKLQDVMGDAVAIAYLLQHGWSNEAIAHHLKIEIEECHA